MEQQQKSKKKGERGADAADAGGKKQQQPKKQQGKQQQQKQQGKQQQKPKQQQQQKGKQGGKGRDGKTAKQKGQTKSKQAPKRPETKRRVDLFSHLKQSDHSAPLTHNLPATIPDIVVKLGLQMAEGIYSESTERCVAMLIVLKEIVNTLYVTPADKSPRFALIPFINPSVDFLHQCRPLSFSMRQALRKIKSAITEEMSTDVDTDGAKRFVSEKITKFIETRINRAQTQISSFGSEKIRDGDVVLVFGASTLIRSVLREAKENGVKFRVVVIDSRPTFSGRTQLKQLAAMGIHCKYSMISGLSYAIREATKVLLAASCTLSNGNVVARVGTAMCAMMARHHFIPVIFCCEAYKFSEVALADSFSENELGDPEELVSHPTEVSPLKDWMSIGAIKLLNLGRDVTPAKYIDVIATDFGLVPPTSSAAILRKADEAR